MKDRIEALIRDPSTPAGAWEAAALDLFRWQVLHNPEFGRFAFGADPRRVEDIPAVPVSLFQDLPLTCLPPGQHRVCFHTSGTTTGRPGVHHMADTEVYDLSAIVGFRRLVPEAPRRAVSLVPRSTDAPHSSLAHMVDVLFPDAVHPVDSEGQPDPDRLEEALRAVPDDEPVFVAATALALDQALAPFDNRLPLPPASQVMVTGGFKGRSGTDRASRLLVAVGRVFGPDVLLVGEYGMTELRSQLWTRPTPACKADLAGPFRPPPWLWVVAVDPGTGEPAGFGTPGQLRFVDLANHDSVLAIETRDHGTVLPDGSVLLHGRLPGAPQRGCSLSVDDARAST